LLTVWQRIRVASVLEASILRIVATGSLWMDGMRIHRLLAYDRRTMWHRRKLANAAAVLAFLSRLYAMPQCTA